MKNIGAKWILVAGLTLAVACVIICYLVFPSKGDFLYAVLFAAVCGGGVEVLSARVRRLSSKKNEKYLRRSDGDVM